MVAAALLSIATATAWSAFVHPEGQGAAAPEFPHNHLVQGLVEYDGGWYGAIAERGYWPVPSNTQSPAAFFPLYPMLMRALVMVGVNHYVAGIIVTLLCGVGALMLFAKWAALLVGEEHARDATVLFALYPFAIYLYGIVYSDALFLLLAVGAFFALEKRQVAVATLLGALATATRPVAPAIVLGLLARNFELQRRDGERLGVRTVLPVFAALGMAAYMLYQWEALGDALLFVHTQSAPGWNNTPGPHAWFKVEFFKALAHPLSQLHRLRLLTHAGATLVALALVWPTWKRLGYGYAVYAAAVLGIPALSSHDFQGLGRYAMAAFPVMLTASLLLGERPRMRKAVLATFAVGLLLLAGAFADGQYVA